MFSILSSIFGSLRVFAWVNTKVPKMDKMAPTSKIKKIVKILKSGKRVFDGVTVPVKLKKNKHGFLISNIINFLIT